MFGRTPKLPADLTPKLDREERVITWAPAEGSAIVVTNRGLWLPGADARLHAGRNFLGGPAVRAISYQYVHEMYCNIYRRGEAPVSGSGCAQFTAGASRR